ncbi:hypothetical protein Mth01_43750 [Sphaerimonospora thailandensis]|uniref:Uncharacterized protein n=2 Tax=Sphaerimonospora thailandensis TaxID=795644 RepID=A0A8J3W0Y5_9ACTN|nr:hypothetical protein Mth01_43750 [Sphaerimonospora thailandensis]
MLVSGVSCTISTMRHSREGSVKPMDAESRICLSDMVPALRWSRPQQVAEMLADPRLPGGWWASITLGRAMEATGVDWLCERLARLAVGRWDHLPLTDLLPALQVHTVDPALPGWPEPVRSLVNGLGGWYRLRRLTPCDLQAPAAPASPEVILATVFREIFGHLASSGAEPAAAAQAAAVPAPTAAPTAAPMAAPTAAPMAAPEPPPPPSEHPMVVLVDGLFRGWDPLTRAVAAQRLFAAEPVGLRELAHNLNVDRDALSHAQRAAEERVLQWLRSSDSAPLTGHLFGLTEWLGAAATQDQLIAADPSHPVEVPALGVPLWRVLVTLMPDRRLQDGWLVVGDLFGLRDKTRQLLTGKPADADVIELLGRLGIRAHSARAWLESMPRPEAPAAQPEKPAPLPRRTPGANGHQHRGGVPIPSQANNGPDAATALAALNALTGGAPRQQPHQQQPRQQPRPHLVPGPRPSSGPASDPRRWQRIDVTSEHLRGGPVAVPEGYAAQLGMRPGTLLSVTGPGDNAVVLVWRDRQPVFDSLQPVLMRLNAQPGDSVYVTVDGYRLDAQLTSLTS